MEEWIKTIFPLVGVIIGWMLSENGKISADKRQDRRKLKKLLYFLLELRYHFTRELSIEVELSKYIDCLKNKISEKFDIAKNDPQLEMGIDFWKPILSQVVLKAKSQDDRFEHLSENIDKILVDLAEIFPLLAYELNGQHNIKERLNGVNNYFSELEGLTKEPLPFDIKQWINPKLTEELVEELDESIRKIASKINRQTSQDVNTKIKKMNFEEKDIGMNALIDEYLDAIIASQAHNTASAISD